MFSKQQTRMAWKQYALGLVVGVALVGLLAFLYSFFSAVTPNTKTYQAVFLTNGQVYFGKLKKSNSRTPVLDDVFYLQQTTSELQQALRGNATTTVSMPPQPQLSLTRLGQTEVHGPENRLFLMRQQILFWENLRADSAVIRSISEVKNQPVR